MQRFNTFNLLRHCVTPAVQQIARNLLLVAMVSSVTACVDVMGNIDDQASTGGGTADTAGTGSTGAADAGGTGSSNATGTNATDSAGANGASTSGTNISAAMNLSIVKPVQYELDVMRVGTKEYIDRDYVYTNVPQEYDGMCYLRTANADKWSSGADFLTLNVNKPVKVYIGVVNAQLPSWLGTWTNTSTPIRVSRTTSDAVVNLFEKEFPAGAITLGGNEMGGGMYVALVKDMEAGAAQGCGAVSNAALSYSWKASTEYVAGYKVYFGKSSAAVGQLAANVSVTKAGFDPARPSIKFQDLEPLGLHAGDTACFKVSAYDTTGESGLSEAMCVKV